MWLKSLGFFYGNIWKCSAHTSKIEALTQRYRNSTALTLSVYQSVTSSALTWSLVTDDSNYVDFFFTCKQWKKSDGNSSQSLKKQKERSRAVMFVSVTSGKSQGQKMVTH